MSLFSLLVGVHGRYYVLRMLAAVGSVKTARFSLQLAVDWGFYEPDCIWGVVMWEYRLVWPSTRPNWWNEVWERGEHLLRRRGDKVESRPDTYLVIPDRPDVGLKFRGGKAFEVKSLHQRSGNWELWEKYTFFRWNVLEAARLANMLRVKHKWIPFTKFRAGKGVEEFLGRLEMNPTRIQVRKKRLQATANELLAGIPGCRTAPFWLAELVEIELTGRMLPIVSVCLETLDPAGEILDPFVPDTPLRCGYPELLTRHLNESLHRPTL